VRALPPANTISRVQETEAALRGSRWLWGWIALGLFGVGRQPLAAQAVPGAPVASPETLFVYGPGGPLPAMKEAAAAFGRQSGVQVAVTGGPTPQWLVKARVDADVIFSGAENMMTDFVQQLGDTAGGGPHPGRIDEATIRPLYLRPVAILVRPGNPKRIARFEDLLRPGTKVLVVQGAGQTGLWEDVAGRTGDIGVVRAFRQNIGAFARNSGEAKQRWMADSTFDAWLIWNIWQVANPTLADVVPVAERWRVYRDAGVALTLKGRERERARQFVAFLESPEAAQVFARWGWIGGLR
jgi:accessory colonization factor AcfC